MQAEMVILVVTWLILVAIQAVTPWLSRRNVLFGVVYARNSIWITPAAKKLRRRYLAFSLTGAAILSVIGIGIAAAMHFAATALAWIQIAAILLSICLNYALIVAAHRKSLQLLKEMGNQQELTQSKVTVDLNKLKPQTLVPAAYGLVLVPQFFLALVLGFQQTSADSWVMILAMAVETLTVLGAFYLSRRARGAVRGNPDAEPRAGKVRNSVLYYLLFTGFLSQSLLVLQLMLPNMSAEGQWWFVIITLTLTLLSVSFLPLVYILGTRRLTAKGSVLNDNQHWVWGMFYYNPTDPALFVEKRLGIGFTLNMAKTMSWVILVGFLLIVAGIVIISFILD